MATFEYKRLERWLRRDANGWASAAVADRFRAGAHGQHYLECLTFEPNIAEQPAGREMLGLLARTHTNAGTLLDFGCGNGVLRQLLGAADLSEGLSYIGVDVNPM